MSQKSRRIPSLRHHRPTGLAVATFNGKDRYFGKFGTPESREAYDRAVAEWLSSGRADAPRNPRAAQAPPEAGPTVGEVILAYSRHAESYYVKHGKPTREVGHIRLALRVVRKLYGKIPAAEFGPLALKACREEYARTGELCRANVNRRVNHVRRMFKWAVSEELVPSSVHHGLSTVPGLKRGRCGIRETEPVRPVPEAFVDAIRPYVARQVWAMVELQRLTGMRPGEVVRMRACDVDTSGRIWVYTPETHKTEHHGRGRKIPIGPEGQGVLSPWLRSVPEEYLFRPEEADAERKAAMRSVRKTKVQPSQRDRRKAAPRKKPGERYTVDSYRRAIASGSTRAAREANKEGRPAAGSWHPNQLRHNAATRFRREFGLDVARAILGHSTPVTTEIYAELDEAKAAEAMARVG